MTDEVPQAANPGSPSGRPNPDPSVLTTQALYREVSVIRELLELRVAALEQQAEERRDSVQSQIALLIAQREEEFRNLREMLTRRLDAAAELTAQKFEGIALQFAERDTRSERESKEHKVAVDAAFAAQKEAAAKQEENFATSIGKSEAATQETMSKLAELFRTTTDALSDKLDDQKDRLTEVDKKVNGASQRVGGAREDRNGLYAALGAVAVVITIVIAVATVLASNGPP